MCSPEPVIKKSWASRILLEDSAASSSPTPDIKNRDDTDIVIVGGWVADVGVDSETVRGSAEAGGGFVATLPVILCPTHPVWRLRLCSLMMSERT